ncbi:tyrosine-type recombinase/integrase [Bacillus sp. AFS088145]|uniref:tyrosine-type recombinase/integrase n=1 Tax=Bacillus sp. AFS088145 TaxID=2033514 RepID=UPI00257069A0|nr:tyrosine-type recombinase/integrase [Bacillus sp. AFS088145]
MTIPNLTTATLPDVILQFASHLNSKGRKESTIKRYCYDLEECFRYFKKVNESFSTLQVQDFNNYFYFLTSERGYNEKTMHRIYVVLNQFYKFLNSNNSSIENIIPFTNYLAGPSRALSTDDFISEEEEKILLSIVQSTTDLSEKQLKARSFLMDRNEIMIRFMLFYGLTLKELIDLQMRDINFALNELVVHSKEGVKRTIILTKEDRILLYNYFVTIPEPVRPHYHSTHPLFVAFDFNRMTFHWVYNIDSPKALTEIAFQKMLRLEVKRAGLRKGLCSQHLRNTFILRKIKDGLLVEDIQQLVGLKTSVSLKRYFQFFQENERPNKKEL